MDANQKNRFHVSKWRKQHPERTKELNRKHWKRYYEKNKEKVKLKVRMYRNSNKEVTPTASS